jgi:tetratricopeptide (TPR) repeat protein
MVYGHLQLGQDSAARAWIDRAVGVSKVTPPGTIVSEYARAAMPARYPLERGSWSDATRLTVPEGLPIAQAITHFARGIGAARSGKAEMARAEIEALASIQGGLEQRQDAYWAGVVAVKRQAVAAWLALAAGDTADALREAKAAADAEDASQKHPVTPGEVLPARELYGDLLLELGRYAEAAAAYEATLERERGRARSIFGAARAAELSGDMSAARERYRRLLELMANADGDRPELAHAREFLRTSVATAGSDR